VYKSNSYNYFVSGEYMMNPTESHNSKGIYTKTANQKATSEQKPLLIRKSISEDYKVIKAKQPATSTKNKLKRKISHSQRLSESLQKNSNWNMRAGKSIDRNSKLQKGRPPADCLLLI
jgi:hypothetical protein